MLAKKTICRMKRYTNDKAANFVFTGEHGHFHVTECQCFNNCCIYLSITRPRWKGRAIVSPCPPSVDNKAGPALRSSSTQYTALKIWTSGAPSIELTGCFVPEVQIPTAAFVKFSHFLHLPKYAWHASNAFSME